MLDKKIAVSYFLDVEQNEEKMLEKVTEYLSQPDSIKKLQHDLSSLNDGRPLKAYQLARLLGVRPSTISEWRKGKSTPSRLAKERIGDLLSEHGLLN